MASTLLAMLHLLIAVAAAQTCFYPDGSADPKHFACTSGSTSVCCAENFQCLSNGLCNDYRYENYTRILRGGCTDKDWGDACPKTCTSIWPQGDEAVYLCSNGKYCCGRTQECCKDSAAQSFDFGSPTLVAIAGKNTLPLQSSTTATAKPSHPTIAPGATSQSSSNIIPIAVGVGVGVAILLIGTVVGVCLFVRRKRGTRGASGSDRISELAPSTPAVEASNDYRTEVGVQEKRKPNKRRDVVHELDAGREAGEVHGDSRRDEDASGQWPNMLRS